MKVNQNLSILFWINKTKMSDGQAPIWARLTINGKRSQFSLGKKVELEKWNSEAGAIRGNSEEVKTFNNNLNQVRGNLQRHYNIIASCNDYVSSEMVRNAYFGIEEKAKTICEAFDYHNQKFKEKAAIGSVSFNTLNRFEITKGKVIEFMQKKFNVSDKPLLEIKLAFITAFEHFLTTERKLQSNTAMKYVKNIKKIMNVADANEWISSNPLLNFKCTYQNPEREILTQEELDAMYQKPMHVKRLEEVRDVYVFCCYTGYAFSDVKSFTSQEVCIGLDGEKWIQTKRIKTDSQENVMLLPVALEIIEKYKTHPYCVANDKLLPVISNQRFNAYLQEIADLCGIKKHLTSHTARHTFATTVTLANDVPIESVSAMLGHNSIRTTQIYAKIVQKKLSNDMKALRERINQNSAKAKTAS